MSYIPILVRDEEENKLEPTLGENRFERERPQERVRNVDSSRIKASLSQLTGEITSVLEDIKAVGGFQLKQITLNVEISAEGKVFLVGKAGAKGGISLTFQP